MFFELWQHRPGGSLKGMDNENLGAVVAALRGQLSQGELAQKMTERGHDWQQTTVSRLERGTRTLKLFEAVDLAAVLGVSLDELMDTANNRAGSAQDRARLAKARNDLRTAHTSAVIVLTELLEAQSKLATVQREIASTEDAELAQQAVLSVIENGDYSLKEALIKVVMQAAESGQLEDVTLEDFQGAEGYKHVKNTIKKYMGVDLLAP